MDTRNGRLHVMTAAAAAALVAGEQLPAAFPPREFLTPVKRDLTDREREEGRIRFADPCACGSGKKFKHCCFTRARR